MFILGAAISLSGILMTMYFKGVNFALLANPAAIFIIVVSVFGMLTATQNFRIFWVGIKAAAMPKASIAESDRGKAASLFRLLSKTTAFAMAVCVIISVVASLTNMNDPERLGHSLSSALSVGVIGLILVMVVFEPIVAILKKRQCNNAREAKVKTPK